MLDGGRTPFNASIMLLIFLGLAIAPIITTFSIANGEDGPQEPPTSGRDLDGPMWPMHGRDPQRSGLSPYDAGDNPGELRWKFFTNRTILQLVIGADGTIYLPTYNGTILAVRPNGTMSWEFEADGPMLSSAVGDDGTIYVGSHDNHTYALNPDGTLKWRLHAEGVVTSPTIGPDGTLYTEVRTYHNDKYFYAWEDRYLYSMDPDGTLNWKKMIEPSHFGSGLAIALDGTIYYGIDEHVHGTLVALNKDGSLRWKHELDNNTDPSWTESSPMIGADGTIYIATGGGSSWAGNQQLYAINPNGTRRWAIPIDPLYPGTALGPRNEIYLSSILFGRITAIGPNGKGLWSYDVQDDARWTDLSTPAVGRDGTIYFTSQGFEADTFLLALDRNGDLRWKFHLGNNTTASSPVLDIEGTVYVSTTDGHLFAIGASLMVPSPPVQLAATWGDGHTILQWGPPILDYGLEVQDYNIYRGTHEGNISLLTTVECPTVTFNDTSVVNGERYLYLVSAANEAGESRMSDMVSGVPCGRPLPPGAINATANRTSINVSWEAPYYNGAEILNYSIYRGSGADDWVLLNTVGPDNTSYIDEAVPNRMRYYYRVTAINSVGEGAPSDEASARLRMKDIDWYVPGLGPCIVVMAIMMAVMANRRH